MAKKPDYDNGLKQTIIIENCRFDPHGKYLFVNDISTPMEPMDEESIPENNIEFSQKKKIGLYNSNLSGVCIIDTRAHISNVMSLCNVVIEGNSSVVDCSYICSPSITEFGGFGEGQSLSVGPEAHGRKITMCTKLTYTEACKRVMEFDRKCLTGESDETKKGSKDDSVGIDKKLTIIGRDSSLVNCSVIVDAFIGDGCICRNASIQNSTLGANVKIIDSTVQNSLLHHHTSIGHALEVDNVLMYDHSSIGHGARVVSSILAPDASISGGECHHSLIGPMVGFHHTSLLIATIWPFGRGNIAYGAKVGANHTGRSNDQECFIGEGVFFGLGVNVKFPTNLVGSPYSIVAAGTTLLPQRIDFPFSLITNGKDESGGYNSIAPGWLIWANPYMIERAAMKYSSRRKSDDYSTDHLVFRRSILEMMIIARNRLKMCDTNPPTELSSSSSPVYTQKDISGLGKCYLSEQERKRGIDSYDLHIKQFLFRGLLTHYKELILLINRRRTEPGKDIAIPSDYSMFYQPLVNDLSLFNGNNSTNPSGDKDNAAKKAVNDEILYILSLMKKEFAIEDEKSIDLIYIQKCLGSMLLLERNYLGKVISCRKRDEVWYSCIYLFV